jgi:DNA polymerase (family 10)
MTNQEIAELLRSVAAAYQLKNEKGSFYKIPAYQKAADAVEHATSELKDLWDDGKLTDVPGIGPSIAGHLDELFRTGESKHFSQVMNGIPPSTFELMKVPGIGPKNAFRLATELKINSIEELEKAAKAGKIATLPRFGEESEKDILRSISEIKGRTSRHLLPYAAMTAGLIMDWMKKDKNVKQIDPLGSLRREVATIGDIDIAVATDAPEEVLNHFIEYPHKTRVLEKGTISSSIIVPGNIQVDLMVQPPEAYGSLLQHFTGSKHHNIKLREYALKKGLSLSEKGIKNLKTEKVKQFEDEKSFYNFLGLNYIPPEMREDTGEIEASLENKLPDLIELKDIKSDLQIHSDFDIETSHDVGASSMEEIIKKAGVLGYEYIAFTEHNPSRSKHKDDEIVKILQRKRQVVDKINYSLMKTVKGGVQKVFNSLEIDILPDGRLPVPDAGLQTLDFALVSIHSSFRGERTANTKRVLLALSHPKVKIFAHPTGRRLNEREGVDLDWPEIFDFCIKNGKWLEINTDPMRLDLPDTLVREGVKRGIKFSMGTDAHHSDGLNNMAFGISVARRGWCSKRDIVNTRSLKEFEKLLNEN